MPLTDKDFLENDITEIMSLLPPDAELSDKFKLMRRWQKIRIKEYGWTGDYVTEESMPYGMNIHTHGIEQTFNHLDFQIVVPLDGDCCNRIFAALVAHLKSGKVFKVGEEYEDVLAKYKVTFIEAQEDKRTVLRVILPDADGKLKKDEIDLEMAAQYDL